MAGQFFGGHCVETGICDQSVCRWVERWAGPGGRRRGRGRGRGGDGQGDDDAAGGGEKTCRTDARHAIPFSGSGHTHSHPLYDVFQKVIIKPLGGQRSHSYMHGVL